MISDEMLVVKHDSLSNVIFILIGDLEGSLSSGVFFLLHQNIWKATVSGCMFGNISNVVFPNANETLAANESFVV